ncbi:hypothetical protein BH11MYX4_BH11MYX4_43730 [soil metagenome]
MRHRGFVNQRPRIVNQGSDSGGRDGITTAEATRLALSVNLWSEASPTPWRQCDASPSV